MNTRRLTMAIPQLWSQCNARSDDSPRAEDSPRAAQGGREALEQGIGSGRCATPEQCPEQYNLCPHQANLKDAFVLGSRSVAVSIGLPKHSIPDENTRVRRLKHLELPSVSLGEHSLNLRNTPI